MKIYFLLGFVLFSLTISAQEVKWYTFEEAVELNKKEPRKIMIDVYTSWCKYCKDMDNNTFANEIIADYLNTAYYPVKFNAEQKADVSFNNYTYKYVSQGSRGIHELAYILLQGQMSYPSTVFMNESLEIIHIQKGFVEPVLFDEILKFIGGSHYLRTPWETWRSDYKSPFK
jgi:uncharacterized protein YyaL (SSP411 family)